MASIMRFDQWQDSDGNPVLDGTGLAIPGSALPTGSIVDVKSVLKTDTQTITSVATGASQAITGLSITHETQNASNKLIIFGFVGTTGNAGGFGNVGLGVAVDGTFVGIADADGAKSRTSVAARVGASSILSTTSPNFHIEHVPGSGSKTYTLRVINTDSVTNTIYVNKPERTNNDAATFHSVSGLTIMEVAG
jgi:hypothetical protein